MGADDEDPLHDQGLAYWRRRAADGEAERWESRFYALCDEEVRCPLIGRELWLCFTPQAVMPTRLPVRMGCQWKQ